MTDDPFQPPRAKLEVEPPAAGNPHVLSRQVAGFLLWTVPLSVLAAGPLIGAVMVVLGGATFADAWKSGIYKRPGSRSFLNISPMAWGVAMALLLIVTYPVYVLSRNRLRTVRAGNVLFYAVVLIGGLEMAAFVLDVAGALLRPR